MYLCRLHVPVQQIDGACAPEYMVPVQQNACAFREQNIWCLFSRIPGAGAAEYMVPAQQNTYACAAEYMCLQQNTCAFDSIQNSTSISLRYRFRVRSRSDSVWSLNWLDFHFDFDCVRFCVSFRFSSFRSISLDFVPFRFVAFRIVSFRSITFRCVSFWCRVVSFRVVSFRVVSLLPPCKAEWRRRNTPSCRYTWVRRAFFSEPESGQILAQVLA